MVSAVIAHSQAKSCFYFPLPQHVVKKSGLCLRCDMDMLPQLSPADCLHQDLTEDNEEKICLDRFLAPEIDHV